MKYSTTYWNFNLKIETVFDDDEAVGFLVFFNNQKVYTVSTDDASDCTEVMKYIGDQIVSDGFPEFNMFNKEQKAKECDAYEAEK